MTPKLTVEDARAFLIKKYGDEKAIALFDSFANASIDLMLRDATRIAEMCQWNLEHPELPIDEGFINSPGNWLYAQYQRLLQRTDDNKTQQSIRESMEKHFNENGKIKSTTNEQQLYLIRMKLPGEHRVFLVKIGISDDPQARVNSLQTANPFKLQLVANFPFENAEQFEGELHRKLSSRKMRGEWFFLSSDEIKELTDLLIGLSDA